MFTEISNSINSPHSMRTHLIKLFYLFAKKDRIKLVGLFVMMIIASLFEVLSIGAIPALVGILADADEVLADERFAWAWELFNIEDARQLLIFGSVFLICSFLLKNGYVAIYKYILTRFIYKRYAYFGDQLFNKYLHAPYEFHLGRNSAQLLRNVTQETQLLIKQFLMPLLKMMLDVIVIIAVFLFLLFFEPIITLVVFGILGGASLGFLRLLRSNISKYGKQEQTFRGRMIQSVNEGIGGLKVAKVTGRLGFFRDQFKSDIGKTANASRFREFMSQLTLPLIETIAVIGMLLIALVLMWQGRTLETIIPLLTLFGAATARLMPAFRQAVKRYTNVSYYSYVVNPIYDDINDITIADEASGQDKPSQKVELQTGITFKDVSFRYPEAETFALNSINLEINKGQAIGFVGPSGAGKTTIADVLLGLLEPQRGAILVDGKDIRENMAGWQRNIGYIPQFIYLSDSSIKRNIAFGIPEEQIDEEQLWYAIKAAQIEQLVKKLPEGPDSQIGEQGVKLSGGQRQRIGIARALYHNPQVLIMDEATSALDTNTERMIVSAIEAQAGKRTIITIAHRLSTVRNADKLFYLEDGKLQSSGTYDELKQNNEAFRKMASIS